MRGVGGPRCGRGLFGTDVGGQGTRWIEEEERGEGEREEEGLLNSFVTAGQGHLPRDPSDGPASRGALPGGLLTDRLEQGSQPVRQGGPVLPAPARPGERGEGGCRLCPSAVTDVSSPLPCCRQDVLWWTLYQAEGLLDGSWLRKKACAEIMK